MTTVLLSGKEATKSRAQSFCNEETEAQTTGAAAERTARNTPLCAEFISNREHSGCQPRVSQTTLEQRLSLTPYMTLLTKVISYKIQMQNLNNKVLKNIEEYQMTV